ncbi:MAG: polysaccharide deacetylase family protein [Desulfobacteraceae bacterium]|nr:polysaccharide deacetylase family protein [Desulfobacteraceae bacterium]
MLAGWAAASDPPSMFRSDEYVVYKMGVEDTPSTMARDFLGAAELGWRIEEANTPKDLRPGQYVVIPLKANNKAGILYNGVQQVPILCYHRFGADGDSPLSIPGDIFEQQMSYLKENGFTVITPEQLSEFLEYRAPLPKKSVLITVDDGYSSFFSVAFPILKKYGFSATIFVYVNYIGVSSKALSWDQLRTLKAEGVTIGSHTIMHSDLSKQGQGESDQAYLKRLEHEIVDSKKKIDARLEQDTLYFAYPFGRANDKAMAVTQKAGYKLAMTVHHGSNPFYANAFALQRDQVLQRDLISFQTHLKTFQAMPLR